MKSFLFLLAALPLAATVNKPLCVELLSGYRNDRIHWHLQQPGSGGALTYSELYRDIEFWNNGLVLKAIHRDLAFYAMGDYAAFGRGPVKQRYADLNFTAQTPHFQFSTDGWAADAFGSVGYAVNLTTDRTYKVLLTPLLGYSAHFEQLKRTGGTPNPYTSTSAVGAASFTMTSSLPQKIQFAWSGFFLGAGFEIEPGGRLSFRAGYVYHWIRLHFHTRAADTVFLFNAAGALQSQQINAFSLKASHGGNVGQTGWAQLDYLFAPLWRFGLGAQIHYFSSQVLNGKRTDVSSGVTTVSQQKFKFRWTTLFGWALLSREF